MSLQQVLRILRARWRVAVGIFAAVVAVVLSLNLMLPKQYSASTSVVVDIKADPVAGVALPAEAMVGYLATQVDIVQSPRVALGAVRALRLDQDPAFRQRWQRATKGRGEITDWIAGILERKLKVFPSGASNVIDISISWPDAHMAAALANAFAQSYIATTIELKIQPAKQYADSFKERAIELRQELESKQKQLSDFETRTGIVATDERVDVESSRLAELSTQLVNVQGQRQESQSRQRGASGNGDSVPEVLQSPVIMALKAELSRAQVKLDDIATRLGVNHPEYKSTAADVASLQERIDRERARIIGSLTATTQVNLRREQDISDAMDAQRQRILELKHLHDQAQVLQNDVLTAQRNLDAVTQRQAQSSLESAMPQTTLALLTPATDPLVPDGPKILLNCMLAALVGAGLGIAAALLLEKTDRRVRSDEDLVTTLGVPLLGRVSAATSAAGGRKPVPRALPYFEPDPS